MKLTISIDDRVLERVHEFARRRETTLEDLVRDYLKSITGFRSPAETADRILELMREHGGELPIEISTRR